MYVADDELRQQVNDRATLVLASVAKKVRKTHPRWANDVVQRLETRLGIHGIFEFCFFPKIFNYDVKCFHNGLKRLRNVFFC